MTTSAMAPRRPMWATAARVFLGLLPLWILLFELVAVPGWLDSIGANPPAMVGLPAGMLLLAVAVVVMAVGVVVLWRSRPVVALVGFVCLTLPATFVMVVGPVLVVRVSGWGM